MNETHFFLRNETFSNQKVPSLLSKRQTDESSNASILLLLSRRLREGFTVDVSIIIFIYIDSNIV